MNVKRLELEVLPQPDDITCGPTCLHAVYRYYGRDVELDTVIAEVPPLPNGGTLAVSLACDALRKGFDAEIYTYNLQLFDPTWFPDDGSLAERLRLQRERKADERLSWATDHYLTFLGLGGRVLFEELNPPLIRRFLDQGTPILTGLSATYLYGCPRELDDEDDPVGGEPTGHFVVLSGYDRLKSEALVADPYGHPDFDSRYYGVRMDRLIGAILLGIVTYDANLLVLTPKKGQ